MLYLLIHFNGGGSMEESKSSYSILYIFSFILIVLGFILDSPKEIIQGFYKILTCPDMLLVDYLAIGGIGATLINSGLLMLFSTLLIYVSGAKINGPFIAGVLTIGGFAFMGKNIINVLPIFLGGLIYSKYKKINYSSILLVLLFATTLVPAITFIALGLGLKLYISIPLAILVGSVIGFVVPPMTTQMLKIHEGFNLYNIGFTGGILGSLIAGILRSLGYTLNTQSILSNEYSLFLRNFLILIFIIIIIVGYIINNKSFTGYKKIFKLSGRLVTDFTELVGVGNTYINMGIMGLVGISYVVLVNGTFDGPVVSGILTLAGFAAFGKHPKNSIPILIGVYLAGSFTTFDLNSTSIVIAALFGTTLAPIAGEYGWFPGIIAGFLHVTMVTNTAYLHGGLNLYNNGFAGGIVAAIMVPIINAIKKSS